MAPCNVTAPRERARCVWRARKILADAFAEDGSSSAQVLQRRLCRAVREARKQVLEDAPTWNLTPGATCRLRVPKGYFVDFAEQVVRSINRFGEPEAQQRVANYQKRLDENRRTFLKELDVYNERLAPGAKKSRMIDFKCMEQELYFYEPLQYWDEDQQSAMRHIIQERLRLLLPNLASLLQAGAVQLMERQAAAEAREEEDSDVDVSAMDDRAREQRERRKKREEELKVLRAHDDAMAKLRQEIKALERANEDLRRQLDSMRQRVESAEAERDRLLQTKKQLQSQIEGRNDSRNAELERANKFSEQQQKDAAANSKAAAAAAAAVKASADRIGDTLFLYTWAEHLKRPLAEELEAERIDTNISKEEWQRRLVILDRHGKEVKLSTVSNGKLLEDQFWLTIVMREPAVVTKTIGNHSKQHGATQKPPDKDELARRVAEAMKAVEDEQAQERAQLDARIRELEDAIAKLQMSSSDEEVSEELPKISQLKLQPEEEPSPSLQTSARHLYSGEVKVAKTGVKIHKVRGIFERLHGEQSDKISKAVMQHQDMNDKPSRFRMAEQDTEQSAPPPQLSAGFGLLGAKQKQKSKHEDEPAAEAETKRPSSAAKLKPVAVKPVPKRGSSATQRKAAWLTAGWQPGTSNRDDSLSSGGMTLEKVMQQRASPELPGFGKRQPGMSPEMSGHSNELTADLSGTGNANSFQMRLQSVTAELNAFGRQQQGFKSITAEQNAFGRQQQCEHALELNGGGRMQAGLQPHDGLSSVNVERVPTFGQASQWGSSVLHTRIPPELAGPARTSLLRAVFDQHLQETSKGEDPSAVPIVAASEMLLPASDIVAASQVKRTTVEPAVGAFSRSPLTEPHKCERAVHRSRDEMRIATYCISSAGPFSG